MAPGRDSQVSIWKYSFVMIDDIKKWMPVEMATRNERDFNGNTSPIYVCGKPKTPIRVENSIIKIKPNAT